MQNTAQLEEVKPGEELTKAEEPKEAEETKSLQMENSAQLEEVKPGEELTKAEEPKEAEETKSLQMENADQLEEVKPGEELTKAEEPKEAEEREGSSEECVEVFNEGTVAQQEPSSDVSLLTSNGASVVGPKCSQGHPLVDCIHSKTWRCLGCTFQQNPGTASLGCRICNFDVCKLCVRQRTERRTPEPLCPNDHPLRKYMHKQPWRCDSCAKDCTIYVSSMGCKTCTFFVCGTCFNKQAILRVRCPAQHLLMSIKKLRTWHCSGCKVKGDARSKSMGCRVCRYDLCGSCFNIACCALSNPDLDGLPVEFPNRDGKVALEEAAATIDSSASDEDEKTNGEGEKDEAAERPPKLGIDVHKIAKRNLQSKEEEQQTYATLRKEVAVNKALKDAETAREKAQCRVVPISNATVKSELDFDSVFLPKTTVSENIVLHGISLSAMTYLHPHRLEMFRDSHFKCSTCGNFDKGDGFKCVEKERCFAICEGCILRINGQPDPRPLPERTDEEKATLLLACHKHPLELTKLTPDGPLDPNPYDEKGLYFCDLCSIGGEGSSYHCVECGFDVCFVCVRKAIGHHRPVFEEPDKERTTVEDKRWWTDFGREKFQCIMCNVSLIGENGWFRCNDCECWNMCQNCFVRRNDLNFEPEGGWNGHDDKHVFSNITKLYWDSIKAKKVARKAFKALMEGSIPLTGNMIEKCNEISNEAFCKCGTEFDLANPYNPRGHPNLFINPFSTCEMELPLHYEGKVVSRDVLQKVTCVLCNKVAKISGSVINPVCSHLFCLDCAVAWCASNKRCPVDGKPMKLDKCMVVTNSLREHLDIFTVPCLHYMEGCDEMLSVANFEAHVRVCPFKDRICCPMRQIGCGYSGSTRAVQIHLDQDIEGGEKFDHTKCLFPRLLGYIRRNEMQKRAMIAEIAALRREVHNVREQINLLMHEREFCYGHSVFEVIEEVKAPPVATGSASSMDRFSDMAIKLKECQDSYQDNSNPHLFQWSDEWQSKNIVLSGPDKKTVSAKAPGMVLGKFPLEKTKNRDSIFYWEILIDSQPGMNNICVGIAELQKDKKGNLTMEFDEHLGSSVKGNSWAWLANGSIRNKNKFYAQSEGILRYDKGAYLGFLYHCDKGEMYLFKNRTYVFKVTELNKKLVDEKTKRSYQPIFYPAVSMAYLGYSVTLKSNAPMQKLPEKKELKSA